MFLDSKTFLMKTQHHHFYLFLKSERRKHQRSILAEKNGVSCALIWVSVRPKASYSPLLTSSAISDGTAIGKTKP